MEESIRYGLVEINSASLLKVPECIFSSNWTKRLVEDQRPLLRLLYSTSGKNSYRHTSGPSSVKTNHIV